MKLIKLTLLICTAISLVLGAKLLQYIYRSEPQVKYQFNQKYQGYVIPISQNLSDYHCIPLKRLNGKELKFCSLRQKMDATTTPRVMGEYNRLTDTILLDKDSPNDRVIHELTHSVDVYQGNQLRDSEIKAQEMQSLYLQLVDLGYVT